MMRCLNHALPGADAQRINTFAGVVAQAVAELIRRGFAVDSFSANAHAPGLPRVWVVANRRTAQAIERGQAAFFMRGHDDDGPYRVWQLLMPPPGVRVYWFERGDIQ